MPELGPRQTLWACEKRSELRLASLRRPVALVDAINGRGLSTSRTHVSVFADEDDLAVIKAAAARRGVAEAELLRDAIHLVALAERRWQEPFFSRTYTAVDGVRAAEALDAVWSEKADDYERDKRRMR